YSYAPPNKDVSFNGNPLTLNGVTYSKGLGMHAYTDVGYDLSGCNRFKANVGVDDEVGNLGSVDFQVYADAAKIYDSGLMTGSSATQAIDVSVPGATHLSLVVTDGGDGRLQRPEPCRHPHAECEPRPGNDLHGDRQGRLLGREGHGGQPPCRRCRLDVHDVGCHQPASRPRHRLAAAVADVEGRRSD